MIERVVIDSNVLIAIDRGDRETWLRLKRLTERAGVPVVPTVVLAQSWRGHQNARMAQALSLCQLRTLDENTARSAGTLCARAGTSDVVDAAVVVTASAEHAVVWSDDPDLVHLANHLPPEAASVEVSARA
jgi:hypothetical protein